MENAANAAAKRNIKEIPKKYAAISTRYLGMVARCPCS
jgi:hypothetical protein